MATVAVGVDGVLALVGTRLGVSDWLEITQERVARFAAATDDHQWIHVDPARAATSRFGGPVAHGQLIVALTSHLLGQILDARGFSMIVNYGSDRVRLLSPVPVGARLRASATLTAAEEFPGGVQLVLAVTYWIAQRRAPVCFAKVILRAYE